VYNTLGVVAAAATLCAGLMAAPSPGANPQTDLDAFMQKVLAQRDENWKKLQQYILDERERIEVHGSGQIPIWGDRREYSWFIKDGYFIRSPLKVNGVTVPEEDRRKAEDTYLRRAKARDERKGPQGGSVSVGSGGVQIERGTPEPPKDLDSFLKQARQPAFVESAYFLRFKFEEGKYAFVGREKFEEHDVLKIEYYPTRLFGDDKKRVETAAKPRNDQFEETLERMMNKVSLVTIWVEPKAHQIVKYTFDNVNFDFLPAAWLVRVSDLKASMTMSQAFKDVWLPRDVDMYFSAMLAVGAFDVRYHLDYHDYRQATTQSRIRGGGPGQ
jgi:hypothetical protein